LVSAHFRCVGVAEPERASQRWFPPPFLARRCIVDGVSPEVAHVRRDSGGAKPARRRGNSASFPHDPRATLADRRKNIQHGSADLQINLPAMSHDRARRLKQPPAHGLHLGALPTASQRIRAAAQNVNQRRTLTPPDFVRKLLKHMEKGRIFSHLLGVQS
jgi:hypothetical protein